MLMLFLSKVISSGCYWDIHGYVLNLAVWLFAKLFLIKETTRGAVALRSLPSKDVKMNIRAYNKWFSIAILSEEFKPLIS